MKTKYLKVYALYKLCTKIIFMVETGWENIVKSILNE